MATATLTRTTRSGRPKLPPISKGTIMVEQEAVIAAELATIPDAKDRLTHLAKIERAALASIEENEKPLRKQALSLALHEGARGVYNAIGVSREAFSRMTAEALGDKQPNPNAGKKGQPPFIYVWEGRPKAQEGSAPWDETVVARAKEKGVRFYRDAANTVPELAVKVVTAKARRDVIRPMRDALVKELFDSGLKRNEIAEIIGLNPSRVSHITNGR